MREKKETVLSPPDLMVWVVGVVVLQQNKTQQIYHSYQWALGTCTASTIVCVSVCYLVSGYIKEYKNTCEGIHECDSHNHLLIGGECSKREKTCFSFIILLYTLSILIIINIFVTPNYIKNIANLL